MEDYQGFPVVVLGVGFGLSVGVSVGDRILGDEGERGRGVGFCEDLEFKGRLFVGGECGCGVGFVFAFLGWWRELLCGLLGRLAFACSDGILAVDSGTVYDGDRVIAV